MGNSKEQLEEILNHLQFFSPYIESLEVGLMLIDKSRKILFANETFSHFNVCSVIDNKDSPEAKLICNDEYCHQCPIGEACAKADVQLCFSRKVNQGEDATENAYSVFSFPLPANEPDPQYYMLMLHDISASEIAFREKQELQVVLANLLESTVDAVLTTNSKGEIHTWNHGAWQVFGYTNDEIEGKHISILIPDDKNSQNIFEQMLNQLDEQGFVRNHRAKMLLKNGNSIDVAVTQTAMRNIEGKSFGYSIIIRDISRVVSLEHSLFDKVMQLEKLNQLDDVIKSAKNLQQIYTAILVAVTAGEGLRFNRAYLLIVDPDLNMLLGENAIGPSSGEEAHAIYSRDIEEPFTLAEIIEKRNNSKSGVDLIVNQQVQNIELSMSDTENPIIRCLNDNQPYLHIRGGQDDQVLSSLLDHIDSNQFVAVPLVWQNQPLGVIIADNYINRFDISMGDVDFLSTFANRIASAISNIKFQNDLSAKVEELKNAYKRLTDSQETTLRQEKLAALGEMSSTVAHEIRNPLSTIGGFARLVLKQSVSDESKRYLKIISDETSRLERILEEILGYVKTDEPQSMSPCGINDLLNSCIEMLYRQLKTYKITIKRNFDQKIPTIICNQDQIKQVLLNVMINGVESMRRKGELTIESSINRNYVFIKIIDTGVGIKEEHIGNIFKAFFTTKSSGVGLGMNVSKKIIEQHSGRIEVTSEYGKGTTFTIMLPIRGKEGKHGK